MDVANPQGLFKPDELASMTFTGQAERSSPCPMRPIVREENKDYVFVQTGTAELMYCARSRWETKRTIVAWCGAA